ncbi:hypothetical protein [Streptomyces sp. WAC06614]|uniref:hypothetical protein n=1 Tax=Streptomyces sp. WAC06614 TaxID=2487416 RepID=UPI001C8EBD22|nr:hypothetical protein [Streptomyces sp. WAC06614]
MSTATGAAPQGGFDRREEIVLEYLRSTRELIAAQRDVLLGCLGLPDAPARAATYRPATPEWPPPGPGRLDQPHGFAPAAGTGGMPFAAQAVNGGSPDLPAHANGHAGLNPVDVAGGSAAANRSAGGPEAAPYDGVAPADTGFGAGPYGAPHAPVNGLGGFAPADAAGSVAAGAAPGIPVGR